MRKVIGNLFAILLLALPYLLIVVPGITFGIMGTEPPGDGAYILDDGMSNTFDTSFSVAFAVYGIVVLANVIFLIYQTACGVSAQRLLFWNMLIKLCYIPIFFFSFLTFLAGLATFLVGGILMVVGTALLMLAYFLPPCLYGVCGCIRAAKEGTLSKALAVVFAILHCIWCIDVIIAVVAYCMVRSNTKKRLSEQMNANICYNGMTYPNGNGYYGNKYRG